MRTEPSTMDQPRGQAAQQFIERERAYYRDLGEHRAKHGRSHADKDLAGRVFEFLIVVVGSIVFAAWAADKAGLPTDPAAFIGAGMGVLTLWKNRGK